MPTVNTIGIECILLWSLNETSDYLDNIDKKERELIHYTRFTINWSTICVDKLN
jgi:hypothetical protein